MFEAMRSFLPGGELKNIKSLNESTRLTLMLHLIRFISLTGQYYKVNPIEMHKSLNKTYGNIVRNPLSFGGKDLIFTYSHKDYETIFRTEGVWPNRRPLVAFDYFRKNVRPDLYKHNGGLINDQGDVWARLRSAANPVMLKPKTVQAYIPAIDDVAIDFIAKMKAIGDENGEMPANFGMELNKWSLESIAVIALDHRLGLITNDDDPESQKIIKVRN